MSNTLLSIPSLSGYATESSAYNVMHNGITDSILLLGHADARIMYEPYKVISPKKAIEFLGSDTSSPLLKAFLESYNAGCKDIWIMAVAPMSEYEPTIENRLTANDDFGGLTFYEKYYERLTEAFSVLSVYDFMEIIVPVEASFYRTGGVDFVTQLVSFCSDTFAYTGSVCLGVLGCRINGQFSQEDIDAISADVSITAAGDDGKFVLLAGGEGIFSQQQMSMSYVGSVAATVASVMATMNLNRSIAGLNLPNIGTLIGAELKTEQLEQLAQAKINMASRTTKGKRGFAYQIRLLTDNTLGQDGSDFWSMSQMHIVANIINQIRFLGFSFIGTVYMQKFKESVYDFLNKLLVNKYIRDYTLNITELNRGQKALVLVTVLPIFGIRQITFKVEVGPGV